VRAAGWAVAIACALGFGAHVVADVRLTRGIDGLELRVRGERSRGVAVLAARLRDPTTVPFFGSSELAHDVENRADLFFAEAPTGFTIVPIGSKAITPLVHALAIQALAPALRGRPVVISLSPFLPKDDDSRQAWFAGNFSRLHAAIALTSRGVPPALRRETARQLTHYPRALGSDPVLMLAAQTASADWGAATGAYLLLRPIILLDRLWLTVVDAFSGAFDVARHQERVRDEPLVAQPADWEERERAARARYALESASNPFGLVDDWWLKTGEARLAMHSPIPDSAFIRRLEASPVVTQFETLARSAQAAGADVLLLNIPYSGAFLDATGISSAARRAYYDRVESEAQRLGVRLIDFRNHDMDRAFLHDPDAHLSPAGWLVFNRAIDDFVHHYSR
jgi:D-alanine transfer protein